MEAKLLLGFFFFFSEKVAATYFGRKTEFKQKARDFFVKYA